MNLGVPSYAENFLAIRATASIPIHLQKWVCVSDSNLDVASATNDHQTKSQIMR
jgi:hypothetical protein